MSLFNVFSQSSSTRSSYSCSWPASYAVSSTRLSTDRYYSQAQPYLSCSSTSIYHFTAYAPQHHSQMQPREASSVFWTSSSWTARLCKLMLPSSQKLTLGLAWLISPCFWGLILPRLFLCILLRRFLQVDRDWLSTGPRGHRVLLSLLLWKQAFWPFFLFLAWILQFGLLFALLAILRLFLWEFLLLFIRGFMKLHLRVLLSFWCLNVTNQFSLQSPSTIFKQM